MTAAAQIRELNDAFRRGGPTVRGWFVTAGAQALGAETLPQAIEAVQAFDAFGADNDPHGEHDFGSLDVAGHSIFWKIDYYDLSLTWASEDPADPSKTRRVLTIMLASEY